MKNLVSVLIPTYNREKLLPRAIDSVINQTYKNWELIIVDDRSTDNTKKLVEQYINGDKRIKYVVNKHKKGPAGARNQGLELAKGKYIAFLDSDDEWLRHHLEDCICLFNKFPELSVVFGKERFVYKGKDVDFMNSGIKSKLSRVKKRIDKKEFTIFENFVLDNLIKDGTFLNPSASMIRREVIENTGFFNEDFYCVDDYEFWIRVSAKNRFGHLKQIQTIHKLHDENISVSFNKEDLIKEKKLAIDLIKMFKGVIKYSFLTKEQRGIIIKRLCGCYFKIGYLSRKTDKIRALYYYLRSMCYEYRPIQITAIKKLFILGYYKK